MAKNKTYKNLYLDILKIGSERVVSGLSYNDLIEHLKAKGYDMGIDCIEIAVRQWFYDSFHHEGADDNPYNEPDDLLNHADCNFVLKGEACLKLISYDNTIRSQRVAYIALIISLGMFLLKGCEVKASKPFTPVHDTLTVRDTIIKHDTVPYKPPQKHSEGKTKSKKF